MLSAELAYRIHLYCRCQFTPSDNTFMLQFSLRTLGPDVLAPVGLRSKFCRELYGLLSRRFGGESVAGRTLPSREREQ